MILSVLKLPSRGLVVFIDTYIHAESRNLKQEVYLVALNSCYIFTKKELSHIIKHDVYITYGIGMH